MCSTKHVHVTNGHILVSCCNFNST